MSALHDPVPSPAPDRAAAAVDPAVAATAGAWEQAFPEPGLRSRVPRGAILAEIGTPLTAVSVCLNGLLLVSGQMAGMVVPVEQTGRGYVVGLDGLWPDRPEADVAVHRWQVRAVTGVDLLTVPRSRALAVLSADPVLGLTALAGLTRRLHDGLAAVEAQKHVPARLRLARYLLSVLDGGSRVLPLPKKDVAALLGVTQQSLSRLLRDLRADGVDVQGGAILCPDRDRLRRLCDPEDLWSDKDFADVGD
ncbi:Crp/Fnr family transcriptional regulator [Novispirillum itersonii]|uniref:CRP/FNR family transcriptional regulator n=1 Tax=Novispirillum itersonii TaxID=189 RepID=A0A7X0DNU8_NOVIT|nr:helix-turn-helix domain-containing protein [Novispirillum itersonii]MBB6212370.1 CRP/FNR family transcriptional regulator [Novispirillum itersonii]